MSKGVGGSDSSGIMGSWVDSFRDGESARMREDSSNAEGGSIDVLCRGGEAEDKGVTASAAGVVAVEGVSGVLEGWVFGLEGEDCDRSCHKGILEVFSAGEVRTDDGFTLPGVVELVVVRGSLLVDVAGKVVDCVTGWEMFVG